MKKVFNRKVELPVGLSLRRPVITLSTIAMSIALISEASAQTERSGFALEEIVVTAQKRAESVQDIPIAISALSATALKETGFDGVEDLAALVPSLQFGNFGAVTFLNVRGIGSENTTAGSDPGVALHIDGVYIGRPVGALFSALDTERVEVLRGPQGTLYGRNATGGSVNLISRKPGEEFGGNIEVTAGDFNHFRVKGGIDIPISEGTRARVVAFSEERDGFIENTFPGGSEALDADNDGVRVQLDLDLADNVSLLLSAASVNSGGVGSQPELRAPFTEGVLFGPGPPPLRVFNDAAGNRVINDLTPFRESKDFAETSDSEFSLFAGTLEWQFDNFTLKSITSYAESEYQIDQDNDQSGLAIQNLRILENSEQVTQEIQILSPDDASFKWIFGAFYFNEEATRRSILFGRRFDAVRGFLSANVPGFNEEFAFNIGGDVESTSYAVFGQATFNLSDALTLTGGLRYTDDEKEGLNGNVFFAPRVNDIVGTDSQEFTGRLALDWTVSDSALLYASFARGYKSGGISQTTVAATGSSPVFEPEFVDALEVGYKSRFWDDRLQFNASAYFSDYTDLQFQIFGAFGPEAGNAGEATIKGLELELQVALSETWRVDGSFTYTDAEYDELITGPGPGNDFSGNVLPRVPDVAFNLGITGEWDLASSGTIKARLDGSYKDEVFFEFKNGPESFAEDFYNINARVFWTSANDRFSAELYATNLTDEVKTNNILVGFTLGVAPGETGQEFTTYQAPRQVGITVGYRF